MLDILLKNMGIDPAQITNQAKAIGAAFEDLKARAERQEVLLRAICHRLEIQIPLTKEEEEMVARESQRFLTNDAETTSPLIFSAKPEAA